MQFPFTAQQMLTLGSVATTLSVFGGFAVWVIRSELAKFRNELLEKLDGRYVHRTEFAEVVKRLEDRLPPVHPLANLKRHAA